MYDYSVKVCNPKKKSQFEVLLLKTKAKFESVDDLKKQILADHKEKVCDPIDQFGYIEPGHGLRGKLRFLVSNEDLQHMYSVHKRKPYEVKLWCYGPSDVPGVKRSSTDCEAGSSVMSKAPRRSYDKHVDKMAKVEETEDILRENHKGKFSEEQLRSWAHMYVMKKHDSLEVPPDKPFWKTPKTPSGSSTAVSPSKRINLRGQCVDQLLKWHELLEKGTITKEQYDNFKSTILEDVNKF